MTTTVLHSVMRSGRQLACAAACLNWRHPVVLAAALAQVLTWAFVYRTRRQLDVQASVLCGLGSLMLATPLLGQVLNMFAPDIWLVSPADRSRMFLRLNLVSVVAMTAFVLLNTAYRLLVVYKPHVLRRKKVD